VFSQKTLAHFLEYADGGVRADDGTVLTGDTGLFVCLVSVMQAIAVGIRGVEGQTLGGTMQHAEIAALAGFG
jgi:hypothetical protein